MRCLCPKYCNVIDLRVLSCVVQCDTYGIELILDSFYYKRLTLSGSSLVKSVTLPSPATGVTHKNIMSYYSLICALAYNLLTPDNPCIHHTFAPSALLPALYIYVILQSFFRSFSIANLPTGRQVG